MPDLPDLTKLGRSALADLTRRAKFLMSMGIKDKRDQLTHDELWLYSAIIGEMRKAKIGGLPTGEGESLTPRADSFDPKAFRAGYESVIEFMDQIEPDLSGPRRMRFFRVVAMVCVNDLLSTQLVGKKIDELKAHIRDINEATTDKNILTITGMCIKTLRSFPIRHESLTVGSVISKLTSIQLLANRAFPGYVNSGVFLRLVIGGSSNNGAVHAD